MTKHSNVIDEILETVFNIGRHKEAGGLTDKDLAFQEAKAALATELVRMMEMALGEDERYLEIKDSNNVHNEAIIQRNQLRAETRTRLTAIIERELG